MSYLDPKETLQKVRALLISRLNVLDDTGESTLNQAAAMMETSARILGPLSGCQSIQARVEGARIRNEFLNTLKQAKTQEDVVAALLNNLEACTKLILEVHQKAGA